jgi:23S rRNA pseudouridine1911/1915/1917 synthase
VDGSVAKAACRLAGGEQISGFIEPHDSGPIPEEIPLDILYEDAAMVAVNKPPGMVVHPAKGHWSGTLTSALAFHISQLSTVGGPTRPGIVHRLDRDTSGVILVAKTDTAHQALAAQFEARTVSKEYIAITRGTVDRDQDIIAQPIGAHPYQREKMAIRAGHSTSRPARTEFHVQQRYRGFSKILAMPKTGRTHQIRVHLANIGCPVLCDRLYAGHAQITSNQILGGNDDTVLLDRQALHAHRISFRHPTSDKSMTIEAPLPQDMLRLVEFLEKSLGTN